MGSCVARDAAMRGLRTALIEKEDFGCGTSWNCLKIVHGGLRYLQHLDITRVRRSIRERSFWLRCAPHLVEPLPVVVPAKRRGMQRKAVLRSALFLNDLVSWDRNQGLNVDREIPRGAGLSRKELLGVAPQLSDESVSGGVLFYDALMHSPERLVLSLVKSSYRSGAAVANHVSFISGHRVNGELSGARVIDRLSGDEFVITADAIVNATGPAAMSCARHLVGDVSVPEVPQSVAVNLVIPSLGHDKALAIEEDSEGEAGLRPGGRRLLIVPWRDRTLIGTGHYHLDHGKSEIPHADVYVDRFRREVAESIPWLAPHLEGLELYHVGFLPAETDSTADRVELRKHPLILDHATHGCPAATTAVTVKFTTARYVAEKVVDIACKRTGRGEARSSTLHRPLEEAPDGPVDGLHSDVRRRLPEGLASDPDLVSHLARSYGSEVGHVLRVCDSMAGGWDRIDEEHPVVRGQIEYAVTDEMARTVDDVLYRRTGIGSRSRISQAAREAARDSLGTRRGDAAAGRTGVS